MNHPSPWGLPRSAITPAKPSEFSETKIVSVHFPPLKKEGRGGLRMGDGAKIPPNPPLPKGGTEWLPKIFSTQGRIGRVSYIGYLVGLGLLTYLITVLLGLAAVLLEDYPIIGLIMGGLVVFATLLSIAVTSLVPLAPFPRIWITRNAPRRRRPAACLCHNSHSSIR
ncbi:MAG: hypothetical protein H6973_06465 [Gammaproteobacteria bacterium]|nr:hypothetical protein [Gammaproteobacteria bacterium]